MAHSSKTLYEQLLDPSTMERGALGRMAEISVLTATVISLKRNLGVKGGKGPKASRKNVTERQMDMVREEDSLDQGEGEQPCQGKSTCQGSERAWHLL